MSCNLPAQYVAALRRAAPDIPVFEAIDAADLAAGEQAVVVAVLVWGATPRNLGLLPRLGVVHGMGAGVDRLLVAGVVPAGVPVCRLSSPQQPEGMGEYVLLHVLRHHRQLEETLADHAARRWLWRRTRRAHASRVGVMGLGAIGTHCCRLLAAVGFEVRGWSRSRHAVAGVTCFAGDELAAFLDGCEQLVCLLPLTGETAGLLGRETLSRLAPGAHLINAGRGAHLVEADLMPLLDEGRLSRATLDVMAIEPPPADHPFWRDPRILMTGHSAVSASPDMAAGPLIANVRRVLAGTAPEGIVDPERGY